MRLLLLPVLLLSPVFADNFAQINLVSDIPGMANVLDPNLKDPWGMSFSSGSPIWVSDRATNVSTLYSGTGVPNALVVSVAGGPTGQVFSGGTAFAANFIFDTLSGTIDSWSSGTTASVAATTAGAQYEGLAIAGNTLYAANFGSTGGINVFNSSFTQETLAGNFVDPNLPAGFSPFNVTAIGGKLYVEFAKVTSGAPVPLPGGGGFVDVFDTNGNLLQRLVSNGPLDAPWGVAMAPAGFGAFGGDLLVGNFGNGEINAFNPTTGAFLGTITDGNGSPIVNPGLWAIEFGNSSANPNALYFNVGLNGGTDGLFGDIQAVPEPASWGLTALGILGALAWRGSLRRV